MPSLSEESKGKFLALQSDNELSYSLDRDQEKEAAFEELASQVLENLSQDDASYVLVIHDTLIAKALTAKDTPAVVESFHQLDGVVDDLLTRQNDGNGNFAFVVLSRGAAVAPVLTTEKATELSNTFFVLSNLPRTFTGAGQKLRGADEDAITDFATFDYKG